MADARTDLLDRIVADLAARGLADRSLRDIATSVGSNHRMVLYHFGSREGLVEAVVARVEATQRELMVALAAAAEGPRDLLLGLWERVSSPELRPFVRLFFETVAASAGRGGDALTEPWLDDGREAAAALGLDVDPAEVRLGIAVTRGLLIDVLVTGDVAPATESLHRMVDRWYPP